MTITDEQVEKEPYPSQFAMKAAVDLEVYACLGRVQTQTVGKIIQCAINAALEAAEIGVPDGWQLVPKARVLDPERETRRQKMADILWCCHVRGPDDVHAAPDYETALKWADITNALNWRGRGVKIEPPSSYDDCLLKAAPAPWPWSAERHAEDLPKSIAGFAPRGRVLDPYTVEECAKACNDIAEEITRRIDAHIRPFQDDGLHHRRQQAFDCAAAIRALLPSEDSK